MTKVICIFHPNLQNFHRFKELGVIGHALRQAGWSVVFTTYEYGQTFPDWSLPIYKGSPDDLQKPDWWTAFDADVFLSYTWLGFGGHFEAVLNAQAVAGAKVILKADSDGLVSPSVDRLLYYSRSTNFVKSLIKDILRYDDFLLSNHISVSSGVVVESPPAYRNLLSSLRRAGAPNGVPPWRVIPNPVALEHVPQVLRKEPLIVSVARWEDQRQKNPKGLAQVALKFLRDHPNYQWEVIGTGRDSIKDNVSKICRNGLYTDATRRLRFVGNLPHDRVLEVMARSQIIFSPSRYEGFGIAVAEALCCGATLVGCRKVPCFEYFVGGDAYGTTSTDWSVGSLLGSLNAETDKWISGLRNPDQVAGFWQNELDPYRIARLYEQFFDSLSDREMGMS